MMQNPEFKAREVAKLLKDGNPWNVDVPATDKQLEGLKLGWGWNKDLTKENCLALAKLSQQNKGKIPSLQCRRAVAEANRTRAWTDEQRRRVGDSKRGKPSKTKGMHIHTQEHKLDLAKQMTENNPMGNPVYVEKVRQSKLGKFRPDMMGDSNPSHNPDVIPRIQAGIHRRPTKPEIELMKLLAREHPGEFAYNGGFELGVSIGARVPDFVNVNSQKQVIELYGDYWHRNDNPQDRVHEYGALGCECLVVWEHELENEVILVVKLREFGGKGGKL